MGSSIQLSVLACACLVGCASNVQNVQVGLANAPWLGGATPETRVHDVISNGRDSCERSAFPPGQVLRGEIPPCAVAEPATVPDLGSLLPARTPSQAAGYQLGGCPDLWRGPNVAENGMSFLAMPSSERLACSTSW